MRLVVYRSMDPVVSRKTRSSDLSIVVGLLMYVWCKCGVGRVDVCLYMSRYYSYTQIRGTKKTPRLVIRVHK